MKCTLPSQRPAPTWQAEKHLQSGDRVWILTDVESYRSSYLAWSEPQRLYRVGIYDLRTNCVGLATFGRDIAFALLKVGLAPPPWHPVAPIAVVICRDAHVGEPKGRYAVTAEAIRIEPAWWGILPTAFRLLHQTPHCPNSKPGMWDDLHARAKTEISIERAALQSVAPFSAGDIRVAIGDPEADVTSVLQTLVAHGTLRVSGKKRGTKYRAA